MPRVQFTKHLVRFFPRLEDGDFEGATVAEIVASIEARHRGLGSYLVDEQGRLRQHVNVFLDNERIDDRERLGDRVSPGVVVSFFQSFSGG